MDTLKFAPRRDWWVWPSAIVMLALSLVVLTVSASDPDPFVRLLALIVLAYSVMRAFRIFTTSYELHSDALVVVQWPLRRAYPYDNIVRLRAMNRLYTASSPGMFARRRNDALSYDVLVVVLLEGPLREVYIAPKDKADFLAKLKERAPHIVVDDRADAEAMPWRRTGA